MRRRHAPLPLHNNTNSTNTTNNDDDASRTTKTSNRVLKDMLKLYSKSNKLLFLWIGLVLIVIRLGLYYYSQGSTTSTRMNSLEVLKEFLPPDRTILERWKYVEETIVNRNKYIPIEKDDDTYDIFHCPSKPPHDYPREYPVMDVLNHWPIDDVLNDDDDDKDDNNNKKKKKKMIHQGLCIFDFGLVIDNATAKNALEDQIRTYQRKEVPFVIRNDDNVLRTVERWNQQEKKNGVDDYDYLDKLLQNKKYRAELSPTNHMMYWNINKGWTKVPSNFKRPTQMAPFTFEEWKRLATTAKNNKGADEAHTYIRFDACEEDMPCDSSYRRTGLPAKYRFTKIDNADFWYDELPFFNPHAPKGESDLYLIDKQYQRGIQCRFGMTGLVAENHFDSDRNFIAVLGGERRYLLGHPQNCPTMYLYEMHHPMERHSKIDWSKPDLDEYPNFPSTHINEVVLQAGDVLYLPTQWFHHIVSLNMNYQCNARSGSTKTYNKLIHDCGFNYKLYL